MIYMSQYLIEKYIRMINHIDDSSLKVRDEGNKKLTLQFYSKGKLFDGKLMIVGRAVNGWDDECEWFHGDYKEALPINLVTKAYNKSLDNPLKWVTDMWGLNKKNENGEKLYNTARSPFWQLTKNVLKHITPEDEWNEENWSSKIIWSNLYKVAPANGGNPNKTLCNLQLDFCKDILNYEIQQNKPKYLLFITGHDWFNPFTECIKNIDNYNPKIVVSERPEFKSPIQMAEDISRKLML